MKQLVKIHIKDELGFFIILLLQILLIVAQSFESSHSIFIRGQNSIYSEEGADS